MKLLDTQPTNEIRELREIVGVWRDLVAQRRANSTCNDQEIASFMVGASVSIDVNKVATTHPSFGMIFDIAAEMELPENFTNGRRERWECIEVLLSLLETKVGAAKRDDQ